MLWFRTGVVVSGFLTLVIAIMLLTSVFIMCVNPSNSRSMNSDPYYNGTLIFYVIIIFSELFMCVASSFGLVLAFRIWRNNNQLDHKLRRLFSLWLATLCTSTFINFIMGILGLVRYREPQEEVMSLFEIFGKYNQDPRFVGSFERYQRENSCCGINGPDDWVTAQFKSGGGGASGGMMGGVGAGGYDGYMGSPSTGKCHLTPPTIPMGCGKKLLDDIHWTQTCYSAVLILETITGVATAALGWYCFFYWIEKEVIIIPEDEVSNLIVIEPESSTSTQYTTITDTSAMADWSRSTYSVEGTQYSSYSRPSQSYYSGNQSHYSSRLSGSRPPSANPYPPPSQNPYYPSRSYREKGFSTEFSGFKPNAPRPSKNSKFSNFYGAVPSVGGPHSAYLSMNMVDPNYEEINQNLVPRSISESVRRSAGTNADGNIRLHQGSGRSIEYTHGHNLHHEHHNRESHIPGEQDGAHANSRFSESRNSHLPHEKAKVHLPREKIMKQMKKKHSFNHMLHKQEKALGGKVMAEMHIDHSRDPQPMNSDLSTSHVKKGHRAHHATIALVKNKKPPKPNQVFQGHEKGHGQTGHLATDILAMSGGAGAAKSLIDNVNLPVEHNADLTDGKYLKKLRKQKKGIDHPDKDHCGHGPVITGKGGVVAAPSADGSQAQLIIDNLLTTAAHEPPPKEDSQEIIKVHEVVEPDPTALEEHHHHHHHGHHHQSLIPNESHHNHHHHHKHNHGGNHLHGHYSRMTYGSGRTGRSQPQHHQHHHHHHHEHDNQTFYHDNHHHGNGSQGRHPSNGHHHHHHEHHAHDHYSRNYSGHHENRSQHPPHHLHSHVTYSQFSGNFTQHIPNPPTEVLYRSPHPLD